MAAEGDIIRGIFTGEEQPHTVEHHYGEVWPIILPNIKHLSVHDSVTVIPGDAFYCHSNIVELTCHNVKRIEIYAFRRCPSLQRLIMSSVEVVGQEAFGDCEAIQYIQ